MLRVGMPDRPGALGAVASRIGAVRADVVGIEILTRSDGRAMDEIAVEIDRELLPLLLSEIAEVDGVVVEEVRMLPRAYPRPAARRVPDLGVACSRPEPLTSFSLRSHRG